VTSFLRLVHILATLAYYRLDELLPLGFRHPVLRLLLGPFKIRRCDAALNRGERLRLALEALGPIFIKFGQLLSTRPDVVPQDLVVELSRLQDRVTPFASADFMVLVEAALGQPLSQLFAEVETAPLASASIAQVHAAVLKTGEAVVIKAVRPGIEHTIRKDITLMRWLAARLEQGMPQGRRLKPVAIVEEYKNTIFDELDLMKETANASQLRRNFDQSPLLYVPKVYWPYCRRNLLVMERIYGHQVTDIAAFTEKGVDRRVLAEKGVEIFFTQVFDHNFFHADMHPGNVYVDCTQPDNPHYIALDLAIMGSLNQEDQYYLARNLLAMFRRNYRQVAELHVLSGWVPRHTNIAAFESAIRAVCEPIFEKPLKEISFGEALITLFQTAERFEMPVQPQLVLLQKTLLNVEGLGRQLYPDLDLWATAHPFLERWLKARFAPKRLWKELKHQAPEWLEALPGVPHLLLETTRHLNRAAEKAAAPEPPARSIPWGGALLVAAVVLWAWPSLQLINAPVAALASAALLLCGAQLARRL
jgi:ubiquinone biosynthesis protein